MRIELCGPLGVGKTTLAQTLSKITGWTLINEPVETHPFLEAFYKHPGLFSFEKNLFFLLDYLHQVKSCKDGSAYIFDHSAVVHRSYATLNRASPYEKPAFFSLDSVIEAMGPPDLLINLVCPADVILERIQKRGRSFETNVSKNYVSALNAEIQRQVAYVTGSMPILNIDAAAYDFSTRHDHIDEVLGIIEKTLRAGNTKQETAIPAMASRPQFAVA